MLNRKVPVDTCNPDTFVTCAICNSIFPKINGSHLKSAHKMNMREYKKLFPHAQILSNMYKKHSSVNANTLAKFIDRYGDVDGKTKYDEYLMKIGTSLTSFQRRYGDDEGQRRYNDYRNKRCVTLEQHIKHYGEQIGTEKYNEMRKRQGTSLEKFIMRDGVEKGTQNYNAWLKQTGTSLERFKQRYGEQEGLERYEACCIKHGNSLQKFIDRYGQDEGRIKYHKYITKLSDSQLRYRPKRGNSLSSFIERHGETEGTAKYTQYVQKVQIATKLRNPLSNNTLDGFKHRYGEIDGTSRYTEWLHSRVFMKGTSSIAEALFKDIHSKIESTDEVYYGKDEYIINCGDNVYFVDFYNKTRNCVIEFYGDYWHCNPERYNSEYYNCTTQQTATAQWEYDNTRIKQIESKLHCKTLVIWESEYKSNPTETVQKCIHFFKKQ